MIGELFSGRAPDSYAVTIQGDDIYISGHSYNFGGPGAVDGPVYWKNGIGTSLPNSSFQLPRADGYTIAVIVP